MGKHTDKTADKTKSILELEVGDVVDYRGHRATVLEVWLDPVDAAPGVREQAGCVLTWTEQQTVTSHFCNEAGERVRVSEQVDAEQRVRLVWPDVPAKKRWMKHEVYDPETEALLRPVPGCTDVCCDRKALGHEFVKQVDERLFTMVD